MNLYKDKSFDRLALSVILLAIKDVKKGVNDEFGDVEQWLLTDGVLWLNALGYAICSHDIKKAIHGHEVDKIT